MLSFVSGLVEVWRGRGQGPARCADTRLSPATAGILTLAQGLADLDPLQFGGLSESRDVPPPIFDFVRVQERASGVLFGYTVIEVWAAVEARVTSCIFRGGGALGRTPKGGENGIVMERHHESNGTPHLC